MRRCATLAIGMWRRGCGRERRPLRASACVLAVGACTFGAWTTTCVPKGDVGGESAPVPARAAPVNAPWVDTYDRTELGPNYRTTSSAWRIQNGKLCARAGKNHPLWLKRSLPENVRIEFDATSETDEGDIKVEVFGDGRSSAQGASYTNASSYLVIFGGWQNRLHVLARLNEHAAQRLERKLTSGASNPLLKPLQAQKSYHFKIERADGRTVQVALDGLQVFHFTDPVPLRGAAHQYFGFNNWEAPVCFDNLSIVPLEG